MPATNDEVVVLTGANSGIGLALARALHAEGRRVACLDLTGDQLDGLRFVTVPAEVEDAIEALTRTLAIEFAPGGAHARPGGGRRRGPGAAHPGSHGRLSRFTRGCGGARCRAASVRRRPPALSRPTAAPFSESAQAFRRDPANTPPENPPIP
ncbi:MAG: hypothetical protein ACNA8N_15155, partial [Trueperaceae bacterium]